MLRIRSVHHFICDDDIWDLRDTVELRVVRMLVAVDLGEISVEIDDESAKIKIVQNLFS
jgi:hypothetical protein